MQDWLQNGHFPNPHRTSSFSIISRATCGLPDSFSFSCYPNTITFIEIRNFCSKVIGRNCVVFKTNPAKK